MQTTTSPLYIDEPYEGTAFYSGSPVDVTGSRPAPEHLPVAVELSRNEHLMAPS